MRRLSRLRRAGVMARALDALHDKDQEFACSGLKLVELASLQAAQVVFFAGQFGFDLK